MAFKKGYDPNRNYGGRPKGSRNKMSSADLIEAIKKVEEKKRQTFLEAWIEAAWGDPNAMSNLANYILPKLKSVEGVISTFETVMSDDLAKTIQDKLRERYEGQSDGDTC